MVTAVSPSRPSSPSRNLPPYERHPGFHVLRLRGSDYDMGYQHGQLLRQSIAKGPLPYFSKYVDRLLENTLIGPLAGPLAFTLGHTVGKTIEKRFPAHARRALDGLADGAGISRQTLMRAVTMPETFLWVSNNFVKFKRFPVAPRFSVPMYGCTSALAWGDATVDGKMLHARNFDYQGVGAWDTEAAVVFHEPEDGQPYVSVSSAGILLGGVTALNASGLSLVIHQHMYCDDFSLGGLPVGVVGDSIMRHAKNLDDARRLLDEHTPNGCWTYIVSSGDERAVLCYEVTPRRRKSWRVDGDSFAYSNIYLDKELAETEKYAYPSQWRWVAERYHRAWAHLKEHHGKIAPDHLAAIMGDCGGDSCRISRGISCLVTVASVVFAPQDRVVWVAGGRAPTSNREFIPLSLSTMDLRTDLPALLGGRRAAGEGLDAFDAYRDAYEAYFNDRDLTRARQHLEKARREQPSQPLYHFMAGLAALNANEPATARLMFDDALALGHPDVARVASFHLWRARAFDELGDRAQAIPEYQRAQQDADDAVRDAAKKGAKSKWKRKNIGLEFTFADVLMP